MYHYQRTLLKSGEYGRLGGGERGLCILGELQNISSIVRLEIIQSLRDNFPILERVICFLDR